MPEFDCVPPVQDYTDAFLGESAVYAAPVYPEHRWTWGADYGRFWARCLRCQIPTLRFVPEEGDRINQETLTVFYREQWLANRPKVSKR